MPYIKIDPIIFQIGSITATWYGFAYMVGFLLGWYLLKKMVAKHSKTITLQHCDDFIIWAMVGVILGGRIGFLLFYRPDFLHSFFRAIAVWEGGMSFHGGLAGVLVATFLFAHHHKIRFLHLTDFLAYITPVGLFFGRIANYINGELYGRITTVPWGTVFPTGGPFLRHPSQLYEAFLEGILLFLVLHFAHKSANALKNEGMLSGIFLIFYSVFRIIIEYFREPDYNLGLFFSHWTMGQLLSIPMFICGLYLVFSYAKKHPLK